MPWGLLSVGHAWKFSKRRHSRGVLIRGTSSTGSFWYKREAALLWAPPGDRAPHTISKAELGHPVKENKFGRLDPGSRSFSRDPDLMTTDEDWNVDRPLNWELYRLTQLFLSDDWPKQPSPIPSYHHSWTKRPDTKTLPPEKPHLEKGNQGTP